MLFSKANRSATKAQPAMKSTGDMQTTGAAGTVADALDARHETGSLGAVRVAYPRQSRHLDAEKLCFTVDDVLTPAECERLVAVSEAEGYGQALVNVGGGRQMLLDDVRKSSRCIIDSNEAVAILWPRLKQLVPPRPGWAPVGLNARLRFLRYAPGDYFAPHHDGCYMHTSAEPSGAIVQGDVSQCTVMLYLNTPARGGATNFLNPRDESHRTSVEPRTGLGLVFDHQIYHEGAPLEAGVKYAIRTDIMFRRIAAGSAGASVADKAVNEGGATDGHSAALGQAMLRGEDVQVLEEALSSSVELGLPAALEPSQQTTDAPSEATGAPTESTDGESKSELERCFVSSVAKLDLT